MSQTGDGPTCPPSFGIPDSFLRLQVETSDRVDVVLLHHGPVDYYADWMECFYGRMLGFDIRTAHIPMSASDAEESKLLLLDSSLWSTRQTKCSVAGDAGLILRGPAGEVQVMLELWCARVHLLSQGLSGECVRGNIDAMQPRLLELVRKYYPEDTTLARVQVRTR
jgi:hypothetical protein